MATGLSLDEDESQHGTGSLSFLDLEYGADTQVRRRQLRHDCRTTDYLLTVKALSLSSESGWRSGCALRPCAALTWRVSGSPERSALQGSQYEYNDFTLPSQAGTQTQVGAGAVSIAGLSDRGAELKRISAAAAAAGNATPAAW